MLAPHKSKIGASSRQQINIKGVKDGVLLLPRDRYRSILRLSSLNFELKSDAERDALIEIYESFLNSVGYPLQILIRTREIDLDRYLNDLEESLKKEDEDIYRLQLVNYGEFIRGLISTNKVLTRHFYIIVPYDSVGNLDFHSIREQLNLRLDIVMKGLSRLGMQSIILNSLEVLELFYSFYNPQQAKTQPLTYRAIEIIHADFVRKGLPDD